MGLPYLPRLLKWVYLVCALWSGLPLCSLCLFHSKRTSLVRAHRRVTEEICTDTQTRCWTCEIMKCVRRTVASLSYGELCVYKIPLQDDLNCINIFKILPTNNLRTRVDLQEYCTKAFVPSASEQIFGTSMSLEQNPTTSIFQQNKLLEWK